VDLLPHLVSPPEDSAAPDRERLGHWSLRDATLLAQAHGLEAPVASPDAAAVASAESSLAASLQAGRFVVDAAAISWRLWSAQPQPEDPMPGHAPVDAQAAKAAGTELRKQLGHYLGATFFYGGEWYWGIDRLHYLEQRLRDEGWRRQRLQQNPPLLPEALRCNFTGSRLCQLEASCGFGVLDCAKRSVMRLLLSYATVVELGDYG
ncbi:MAG: hypothetical protein EBW20_08350, partial [Betaproteobacteria bacterium]|nr:hypothetical protein [Betaproteobacteria bacterium]